MKPTGVHIQQMAIAIPTQEMMVTGHETTRLRQITTDQIKSSIQDQKADSTTSTKVGEKYMYRKGNRYLFISILIFQTLCPADAADFKQCESVRLEKSDVDLYLIQEILKQGIRLIDYGNGEDVSIELIATNGTLTVTCIAGMMNAHSILLTIKKFQDINSEKAAQEAYLTQARMCIRTHQHFEDRLNDWIPKIKNQSIRDDIKKIKQNNLLTLNKLSPCME